MSFYTRIVQLEQPFAIPFSVTSDPLSLLFCNLEHDAPDTGTVVGQLVVRETYTPSEVRHQQGAGLGLGKQLTLDQLAHLVIKAALSGLDNFVGVAHPLLKRFTVLELAGQFLQAVYGCVQASEGLDDALLSITATLTSKLTYERGLIPTQVVSFSPQIEGISFVARYGGMD